MSCELVPIGTQMISKERPPILHFETLALQYCAGEPTLYQIAHQHLSFVVRLLRFRPLSSQIIKIQGYHSRYSRHFGSAIWCPFLDGSCNFMVHSAGFPTLEDYNRGCPYGLASSWTDYHSCHKVWLQLKSNRSYYSCFHGAVPEKDYLVPLRTRLSTMSGTMAHGLRKRPQQSFFILKNV
jgi:hypothetical protein